MSRILIIGGHGKVALLLAPLLVARGDDVTSVIRNPAHAADVAATGAAPWWRTSRVSPSMSSPPCSPDMTRSSGRRAPAAATPRARTPSIATPRSARWMPQPLPASTAT